MLNSAFQKLWGEGASYFCTTISGIVWAINMSYDWLMVVFGNRPPIVNNAGFYLNDPGNPNDESWCAISLKFLEWQMSSFIIRL